MPISRRLAALALAGLAGCAASLGGTDSASLRVEGARVTIVAPEGLCIDPTSPDVGRAGGFLLISDCALVRSAPETARPLNGVITVSVSTAGLEGDLTELEAFLRGPGRAGLSRSRNATTVAVLDSRRTDRALFLKVRDVSPSEIPGASDEFWRVFFAAGPRLVTASVVAFSDITIPDARSIALLSELENRTTAANPVAPSPVAAAPLDDQAADTETEPDPQPEADAEG